MPKLKNQVPKMCKLGDYAVVYVRGKRVYLGTYGSQEAKIGYTRILAELANPALSLLVKLGGKQEGKQKRS